MSATQAAAPEFIGDDWLFNDGWSFRDAPPADLAGPLSPLAWDRFVFIFTQAKRGAFEHVEVLSRLLVEEQSHPLFLATMYLSAAIGGSAEQAALQRLIGTDWFTQAADAIVLTGDLAVVDTLLARRRAPRTEVRETMESALSRLLEVEPDRFYDTGLDDDAYDALVRAEVAQLIARHGSDMRITLGAPLRARTLLAKLTQLAKLDRDDLDEASSVIGNVAFHLETFTGLPSKGVVIFDQDGNDIVDRSRLNRFVEAVETWDAKHRPRSGRRMFFGHAVPDVVAP